MDFFHFMRDFLSSAVLGFYFTENTTEQALKILYTSARHEIGRYYGFIKYQKKLVPMFSEGETSGADKEVLSYTLQNMNEEFDQKLLDMIWDFIRNKDELTYRAFLLHYVGGLSFKECANLLKCKNSKIVHRVYRTIEEMKKLYKEDINYGRK